MAIAATTSVAAAISLGLGFLGLRSMGRFLVLRLNPVSLSTSKAIAARPAPSKATPIRPNPVPPGVKKNICRLTAPCCAILKKS